MAPFLRNVTICILLLSCVSALATKSDSDGNTSALRPARGAHRLRCLWCNSRTLPGCYVPFGDTAAARECEATAVACYTRFDTEGEMERDCFSEETLTLTQTCADSLCNNVSVDRLSLIDNQVEWKEHLRLNSMSVECRRGELCETARVRGHVSRGCARAATDSVLIVCAGDECNNHVDINSNMKLLKARSTGSRPLHNTLCSLLSVCIFLCIFC